MSQEVTQEVTQRATQCATQEVIQEVIGEVTQEVITQDDFWAAERAPPFGGPNSSKTLGFLLTAK